jgi:flagellar motor switch protein FliM
MTLIETRLVQRILERGMTALAEAWESVKPARFSLGDMESNPQIVQIVPPNEVVVVIGFEIKMTSRAGTMSLCIPFNVIEPFIEDLSSQSWFVAGRAAGEHQWESRIAHRLTDAALEVTAMLAQTTITVGDLRHLEVGDVIVTEKPSDSPVVLEVGGRPKFLARIGRYKGSRALKVDRAYRSNDRT